MKVNKLMMNRENQENLNRLLLSDELECEQLVLLLGLYVGMRTEEIPYLKWSDIDFSHSCLHIAGRDVPLSEDVLFALAHAKQLGTYVISPKNSKGTPATRMTISRMAKKALTAYGFPSITLRDLRGLFILRAFEEYPIKQVARISGCEIQCLRAFSKENHLESLRHVHNTACNGWDVQKFKEALEQEGDTLDTRVIWLCWHGGLTLKELSDLQWDSISISEETWQINGQTKHIPAGLCERLAGWETPINRVGTILKGKLSGKKLDPIFASTRGKEFLIRNGFETIKLNDIRGQYYACFDSELSTRILGIFNRKEMASERIIACEIGIPQNMVRQCLHELIQSGNLRYSEVEHRYLLPSVTTNKEDILAFINNKRKSTEAFTDREIVSNLGLSKNLVVYYLQQAEKHGIIKKIAKQTYVPI